MRGGHNDQEGADVAQTLSKFTITLTGRSRLG